MLSFPLTLQEGHAIVRQLCAAKRQLSQGVHAGNPGNASICDVAVVHQTQGDEGELFEERD